MSDKRTVLVAGATGQQGGAAIDAHDFQARNPLHQAADSGHADVVAFLLSRGASDSRGAANAEGSP